MRNNYENTAAMTPMSVHWDRNEFVILSDLDDEGTGCVAQSPDDVVVLLRRARDGGDFVTVAPMPRCEADTIIATAYRHDLYADQIEQSDVRDRERAEQLRRGFIQRRYEGIGWFRDATGRERGPKLVLANVPPDDGHTWHAVGMVQDAPA